MFYDLLALVMFWQISMHFSYKMEILKSNDISMYILNIHIHIFNVFIIVNLS